MGKSLMGAAGGGKVTVEGLSPATVAQEHLVSVRQGGKILASVKGRYTCLASYTTNGNQGYKGWYLAGDGSIKSLRTTAYAAPIAFTVGGTITQVYFRQEVNGRGYNWNFGGVTGSSIEGGALQTHDYKEGFTNSDIYQSYGDVINNFVFVMGYINEDIERI